VFIFVGMLPQTDLLDKNISMKVDMSSPRADGNKRQACMQPVMYAHGVSSVGDRRQRWSHCSTAQEYIDELEGRAYR
jgi:hypothetical protein